MKTLLNPSAERARPLNFALLRGKTTSAASVETEILLCCARPEADSATMARLNTLVQHDLDWPRLLRVATRHGMIPLMFRRLCALPADRVPRHVLQRLRKSSQSVVWHNLSLTAELTSLLGVFRDNGIDALPYKGPTLAMAAYGDLSLRHFNDLDILMSRAHILAAKKLLMSRGYRPQQQLANRAEEWEHLRWDCQYNFFHPRDDLLIELHWKIRSRNFPFGARFEDLWKRTEHTCVAGSSVVTMAAEDLIIMLCVHGAKHRWERLNWICDIAHLMHREKALNWQRIRKEAVRLKCERVLVLGALLAHNLLGAELPGVLGHHARRDRVAHWLATQVRLALFRSVAYAMTHDAPEDGTFDAIPSGALRRFFFQLAVRKTFSSKVSFITYLIRFPLQNSMVRSSATKRLKEHS